MYVIVEGRGVKKSEETSFMVGPLCYKHNFFGRDMPDKMKRRDIALNEKAY